MAGNLKPKNPLGILNAEKECEEYVNEMLAFYDREEVINTMREWYDGHQFGGKFIYCSWDVIKYTQALKKTGRHDLKTIGPIQVEMIWWNYLFTKQTKLQKTK